MYGTQSDQEIALLTFYLQGRGSDSHGYYNKKLAKQLGSVVQAILLEEIVARSFKEREANEGWFTWSHNQIKTELCISHTTVDRIVSELRSYGVEDANFVVDGVDRRHYRIHFGMFIRSLASGNSELKTAMSKRQGVETTYLQTVDSSTGVCQNDIPRPTEQAGGEGDNRGREGDTVNAKSESQGNRPTTKGLSLFDEGYINGDSLDVDALVGGGSGGNPARASRARTRKPPKEPSAEPNTGVAMFVTEYARFMNGVKISPNAGHCIQINKLRSDHGDEIFISMLRVFFSPKAPWPAEEDGWSPACFIKHSHKWVAAVIKPKNRSIADEIAEEVNALDPAFDAILLEAERNSRFNPE